MVYEDKSIQCVDCGAVFVFSADEQALFATKGYQNEPKRCVACRQARKSRRDASDGFGYRPLRQMYPVVCAQCGKETEVPFEPRQGRPVYCSECYNSLRTNR
ncbi:MAG: zinc-ribbon domain containing protein [Dehalococcoidales bacterium]|nr:MAG: zinc-ribbon domain containing protein [Dehalococcoidales bacterium]